MHDETHRPDDLRPGQTGAAAPHGRGARGRLLVAAASIGAAAVLPGAALAAFSAEAVIARAERALGSAEVKSLRFAGTGTGATFGQAFEPGGAWPKINITYARTMDYGNGSMREESARSRAEPNGGGAIPLMGQGEQRVNGFAQGTHAWNVIGPAAVAAPVAVAPRMHDLWTSPHGVLVAARRHNATVDFKTVDGKSVAAVKFTVPGLMAATAFINEDGLVERVEARHPHPVTGDTTVVTDYSDYREHGKIRFPMRVVQSHFGQPTLDVKVTEVQVNPTANFNPPDAVRNFAERVVAQQVADGVWFLGGGSHNSVAIEMKDHVVVVEAPLYDGRSALVMAEAGKLANDKPVRTVINSHHHFDHSGGLRTAVAGGAQLLVTSAARPYFEKTFANPNRVAPDMLAKSGRKAKIAGYSGKTTLSDGARTIEIHSIEGGPHAKGFTMVYLPREKLLVQADAFTPGAPNSPPPNPANANHVNLVDNVERLKLAVDRILPLHGTVVPLGELYRVAGRKL